MCRYVLGTLFAVIARKATLVVYRKKVALTFFGSSHFLRERVKRLVIFCLCQFINSRVDCNTRRKSKMSYKFYWWQLTCFLWRHRLLPMAMKMRSSWKELTKQSRKHNVKASILTTKTVTKVTVLMAVQFIPFFLSLLFIGCVTLFSQQ